MKRYKLTWFREQRGIAKFYKTTEVQTNGKRPRVGEGRRLLVSPPIQEYIAEVEELPLAYICDNKRHLICTPFSVENLHIMAEALNLKRCWFHNKKGLPHYDIPVNRQEEIEKTCTVVKTKTLIRLIKNERPNS